MPSLASIVAWLDQTLNTRGVADYPGAHNGLQLENSGAVSRVGAAVDSGEPVLRAAVEQGIDLLLVHHGLLWQPARFTGAHYRKLRAALRGNLAVYASHLPLDLHPQLGNNAQLRDALGLTGGEPAFPYQGQPIGLIIEAELPVAELAERLQTVLGGPARWCPGGPETTRRIGIVTGAAGSEVAQAAAEGVDTFITGEGPHWSYTLAEELGLHVFYGGHYATETFGVKALAAAVAHEFSVPWETIDHPTGL